MFSIQFYCHLNMKCNMDVTTLNIIFCWYYYLFFGFFYVKLPIIILWKVIFSRIFYTVGGGGSVYQNSSTDVIIFLKIWAILHIWNMFGWFWLFFILFCFYFFDVHKCSKQFWALHQFLNFARWEIFLIT